SLLDFQYRNNEFCCRRIVPSRFSESEPRQKLPRKSRSRSTKVELSYVSYLSFPPIKIIFRNCITNNRQTVMFLDALIHNPAFFHDPPRAFVFLDGNSNDTF